jgi:hypothetical protein
VRFSSLLWLSFAFFFGFFLAFCFAGETLRISFWFFFWLFSFLPGKKKRMGISLEQEGRQSWGLGKKREEEKALLFFLFFGKKKKKKKINKEEV